MNSRIIAALATACSLLLAAGCSGTGTMGAPGPSGDQPLIADPSSGGSVAEPADESGDAALSGEEDGEAGITSSGLQCTFDKTAQAEVGKPFSLKLTASGGSGNYLFSAEDLPPGLSLTTSSATISGAPAKAGDFKAGIGVQDIDSDRSEHCSLKIGVQEKISLSATPAGGDAQSKRSSAAVWKLLVNGTEEGDAYHWSFSDSTNLCGSASEPATSLPACTAPPLTGKTLYLWLKASSGLTRTVEVTGDSAVEKAAASVTFEHPEPTIGPVVAQKPDGQEGAAAPRKTALIRLRTITGPLAYAGTDCRLELKMCTDDAINTTGIEHHEIVVENCQTMTAKTDKGDLLEKGKVSTFLFPAPANVTSDHTFFSIGLKKDSCTPPPERGESRPFVNRGWLLQGLELTALYDDGTRYRYFNPCVEKWIAGGESLKFSRKDTAVCAIVSTADDDNAGTNDLVRMMVQVDEAAASDFWSAALGMASYDIGAMPHFLGTYKASETSARTFGQLFLNWSVMVPFGLNPSHGLAYLLANADYQLGFPPISPSLMGSFYDDFKQGKSTSYGDYVFGWDPFLQDAVNVRIEKNKDGDHGGWHLKQYEVFIFNPGMENGGRFRHKVCTEERWLQDPGDASGEYPEDGLITTLCQVNISGQSGDLITDAIGGHFD